MPLRLLRGHNSHNNCPFTFLTQHCLMKKFTLLAAMACALMASPLAAQTAYSPSASDKIYNLAPFNDANILNLFVKAIEAGRQYPTMEEFEKAGFNKSDIEFWRSHVRPRTVIRDQATQLNPKLDPYRNLWFNIPSGAAKGLGGFPSTNTGDDTFTMWNYTNLFGNWNHGLFSAPGCWTDAAHKHGTDIFSGIKFFDMTGNPGAVSDSQYTKFISLKNPDGSYKYVKPVINCLMYFGWDGINYNWEDNSYGREDVVAFHRALYKEAEAQGFKNFHIGLYTGISSLNSYLSEKIYGTKEEGKIADLMLNYVADDFASKSSANGSYDAAVKRMGTGYDVYMSAWIVTMNRSWQNIPQDKPIGICLWGEHNMSRWYSYNQGKDAIEFEHNLQELFERTISGGYKNPAKLPSINSGSDWGSRLASFPGMAHWIAERSTVQGKLPFYTYFNIGSGERYNYKGKKTAGSWYNMSSQDMVPTYRWLVYEAGTEKVSTDLTPSFSLNDSYIGGSSLLLKGKASTTGSDLILYRTKLTGMGTPVAKVAVKQDKAAATNLELLVVTADKKQHRFPVEATKGKAWEEKTIKLEGLAGQEIAKLGFTVKGNGEDMNLYVGELMITDDTMVKPAEPKDLVVEVKEETTQSLSIKANWALNAQGSSKHADKGLTYNDEANVDHFEVLYKAGENDQPVVVSKVSSWAAFVGGIKFENAKDMPYIGVRSVSTDLKTYSPTIWVAVPRAENVPDYKPSYGRSQINQSSEGYTKALKARYFDKVVTTGASGKNLDYTYSRKLPYTAVDSTNYVNATDHVLHVKQGDKVTFTYTMNESDGDNLKWCVMKAYIDYNGNSAFDAGTDEVVAEQGVSNQKSNNIANLKPFEFTIPTDARKGRSSLRLVFSDAWSAHPGPTGYTDKGYTIDFGVEISGDNAERPIPATMHDQGKADLPDSYTAMPAGIAQTHMVASQVVAEGKTLRFSNVEKAWVFGLDGRLVKFLPTATVNHLHDVQPGAYIVKMQNANVIRSAKVVLQ